MKNKPKSAGYLNDRKIVSNIRKAIKATDPKNREKAAVFATAYAGMYPGHPVAEAVGTVIKTLAEASRREFKRRYNEVYMSDKPENVKKAEEVRSKFTQFNHAWYTSEENANEAIMLVLEDLIQRLKENQT